MSMSQWVPEKSCTAQEARTQWYRDFAGGIGVYERLGKVVNAIGLLIISSNSVESRFLTNVQQIERKEYCLRKVL